jgi:thiosulfate dehydrogenase [quinone] large subunit
MANDAAKSEIALQWSDLRARPLRGIGIAVIVLVRLLYGLFYLGATINKFQRNYMFSDYPLQVFREMLDRVDPASFGAAYLTGFIIPNYHFIGWFITWGELAVTVGLILGLCTRWAGALALWITINIGLTGAGDSSLIVLGLIAVLFIVLPTGHWLGLDRRLHARYPRSILFR